MSRVLFIEVSVDPQPPEHLNRAEQVDNGSIRESVARPRFVPLSVSHVQETLTSEMETNAGVEKVFVSVLHVIVSPLGPIKWMRPFQPEVAAFPRVKIDLSIRPAGCKSCAVIERGVHLEIAAVVLHLIHPSESARVVAVGHLRAYAMSVVR